MNHKAYDYDGNEVTKGIPDPFVDSLIHSSIIVQIPLLHGQINNRLDKVLSVFDQNNKEKGNQHLMELNDDLYAGDADMEYILRRLLMASSDAQLRQDMNVEDEYFKAIEDRDTAIMSRDKIIREKDAQLTQKDAQLSKLIQKLKDQGLSDNDIEQLIK